jgi:hypothetical protein
MKINGSDESKGVGTRTTNAQPAQASARELAMPFLKPLKSKDHWNELQTPIEMRSIMMKSPKPLS